MSLYCRRDPDAFAPGSTLKPYLFTQAILPDAALSSSLHQHCTEALGQDKALQAFNVTADSFYSSQVHVPYVNPVVTLLRACVALAAATNA